MKDEYDFSKRVRGQFFSMTRSHESATIERFQRDPDFAAEYLDTILKDGDEAELLQALHRLAKIFDTAPDGRV
jgi:DNA-binding phage protein